jgi:hypothetical protein
MARAYAGPADALARYEALIAMYPTVERKGASTPYTSLNGHMFSFLDSSGALSIRLPPEDLQDFLERHHTNLSEQHGHVLKEFALVPPALFGDIDEMSKWFARSYQWTATRRPKPKRA